MPHRTPLSNPPTPSDAQYPSHYYKSYTSSHHARHRHWDTEQRRTHPLYAAYVVGRPTIATSIVPRGASPVSPDAAFLQARMSSGRFTNGLMTSALGGSSLPNIRKL